MYIKEVRIHGFKSYRERTVCGPLSPMHNSVVGFNGSGKSNFFAALRFVLSEQNATLRPEERSKLLNEGAGASVMSAYVEIVFDNTDKRIDSERDEVIIKRQIGLKKDEYFVDGKHVSRTEISNMLETAGFSKSNPYYIVEQGKVTAITQMTDAQRLALIKDVAGTNVYEEKKGESEKILNDSLRKMDEIKNNLGMIESRLEKLDKEKEELSEYYALDKERRSLHHALLTKRSQVLRDKLTELEKKKHQLRTDSGQDSQSFEEMEARKESLQQSLNELHARLEVIERDKAALGVEEDQQYAAEGTQQVKVNSLQKNIEAFNREMEAKKATITENNEAVAKLEKVLERLEPQIKQNKEKQDKTKKEFNAVDSEKEKLSALERKSDYGSQAERDQALNRKKKDLDKSGQRLRGESAKLEQDIENAKQRKLQCEEEITKHEGKSSSFDADSTKHAKELEKMRKQEIEFNNKIRELQKKQQECEKETQKLKTDLDGMDSKLSHGMPHGTARAIRFLDDFCQQHKIEGYYGPLIHLIQCRDLYYTAVEQVGGRQMWNAVVEDENVATKLINAMKQAKPGSAGRMSFMPLNKLRPQKTKFPEGLMDAEPLVTCIKCDGKFKVAVEQVFGSALLCKDLDVANTYRQQHDLECVTMDGDKVQRKGAIKGGYHDVASSKLRLVKDRQDKRTIQDEKIAEESAAKKAVDQLVQQQQQLMTQKTLTENKNGATERQKRDSVRAKENLKKEVVELLQEIKSKEHNLATNKTLEEENQHEIDKLDEQLKLPFNSTITEEQRRRLSELTQQHTQLNKQMQSEQQATAQLETQRDLKWDEKQRTENELQELLDAVVRLQGQSKQMTHDMAMENSNLEELRKLKEACAENSKAKEQEQREVKTLLDSQEEELKKVKNKLKAQDSASSKIQNQLSTIAADREKAEKDLEVANKQLAELGSLPEAFDKYKGLKETELNDKLVKVTGKLGKFKNVNKKAMDQFNQFTDQKEKFQDRMRELKEGEDSIRKLIENLDAKKDNALQTTFKMVSKHFSDVFKSIVTGGEGGLIMKTKDVQGDEDGEGGPASVRAEYTGIGVEVKFAAGTKVHKMRELSGGQQTLVALTIIFAIQRCDPAPFYLFDEVDANLDAMYRGAVAKMITQQKKAEKDGEGREVGGCQFLTSSFHEELVKAADCHWLVSHTGMSRITRGDVSQQLTIVRKNASTVQGAAPAR